SRRVSQDDRERSIARASFSGGQSSAANRSRNDKDRRRNQGTIRDLSSGPLHAGRGRVGGLSIKSLHTRQVPSRQGDRHHRRGGRSRKTQRGAPAGRDPRLPAKAQAAHRKL